ncbi:heparin lyase I family protein [Pontibacter anaerobius]|uniref:Heparin lyase I family protein n=1 Tax=Pontibacter anaerobius TaxID=2993940 RepID=A0ABT3RER3_9BACT|nr:heparin lyase I family protein [Pontibacter anaerobius]MCX2739938.1 heparin lyase I family protein [Pontibacter anaerobius]
MRIKQFLAIALLSALGTACQKDEEMLPDNIASTSSVDAITSVESQRKNLLIEELFEASKTDAYTAYSNPEFDFYGDFYRVFTKTSYGFNVSSSEVRNGKTAARFELRKSDSGVVRAEIAGRKADTNRNRWYGLSIYLPSSEWSNDTSWDIITQFNGVPDDGEPARNPPINLYVKEGRLKLQVIWASERISSDTDRDGEKVFDLGLVEKDKWLDFVYHINYSYSSDGVLEIWKNGSKIIDYRGPNSYNDSVLPYFKVGLYKRHWPVVSKRVMYADEVRVGNENATYNDVVPSGSSSLSTGTVSANPSSTGITLVNADTNKDLMEVKDGAVLNLATLGSKNLNLRANTGSEVGSVVFSLTGTQTKTVTENIAPYAFAGDDMNGDYYAWTPSVGKYTLTVTPYSSSGGKGTAGQPTTVSFTVTNQTQSLSKLTNAGGQSYNDTQSRTWATDNHFSGGITSSKSIEVANTSDDALYRSYRFARYGAAFSYSVPVDEAGTYTVKLHFVEPYFKASSKRVFNVDAEGQRVLSNFDVYSQVGFGKALVKTISNVSVKDGELDLNFSSVTDNAIISGIEIVKQ